MRLQNFALASLVLLPALGGAAHAQLTVRSGAGANAAAITGIRDTFRTDLGGGTTAGANGSFGGVRREINWDGVPATLSAPNNLPANFFNVNSPRGAVFSTVGAGTGFQVSGNTADAGAGQPAAANFGNLNASYTAQFQTFSPQRLFTSLGNNVYDVTFFVPGTNTPALVTGFGKYPTYGSVEFGHMFLGVVGSSYTIGPAARFDPNLGGGLQGSASVQLLIFQLGVRAIAIFIGDADVQICATVGVGAY